MTVDHPAMDLQRLEGGFRLVAHAAEPIEARAEEFGWRLVGPGIAASWRLVRRPESGGFALVTDGDDDAAAISSSLPGVGAERDLRYLLMEDGRLFRMTLRGPRDGRWELGGWETSGAYLIARPRPAGWRIEPTPASAGLPSIRALSILFAAEVLEAEARFAQEAEEAGT